MDQNEARLPVRSSSQWKPGQSGNPAGRPPKGKALAEILRAAGKEIIDDPAGGKVTARMWMAKAAWRLLTFGEVELLGGHLLKVDGLAEWKQLAEWIFTRTEGLPVGGGDTGTSNEIRVRFIPPGGDDG